MTSIPSFDVNLTNSTISPSDKRKESKRDPKIKKAQYMLNYISNNQDEVRIGKRYKSPTTHRQFKEISESINYTVKTKKKKKKTNLRNQTFETTETPVHKTMVQSHDILLNAINSDSKVFEQNQIQMT